MIDSAACSCDNCPDRSCIMVDSIGVTLTGTRCRGQKCIMDLAVATAVFAGILKQRQARASSCETHESITVQYADRVRHLHNSDKQTAISMILVWPSVRQTPAGTNQPSSVSPQNTTTTTTTTTTTEHRSLTQTEQRWLLQ